MIRFSKYIGIVKVSDPQEVSSRVAALGGTAHSGAIFVECPELGFQGEDLLYCRYGLSFPYIRVQEGDKVLIEPTIGDDERWFYVGLADCAGTISPTSDDQLVISVEGMMITFNGTDRVLDIDVDDGTKFKISPDKVEAYTKSGAKMILDGKTVSLETPDDDKILLSGGTATINGNLTVDA